MLSVWLKLDCLSIVLDYVPTILNLLDRAIVQLFERAVKSDDDVFGLSCLGLLQASIAIVENALLSIVSVNSTVLKNEVSLLKNSLKVPLRVLLQEVTASDSL